MKGRPTRCQHPAHLLLLGLRNLLPFCWGRLPLRHTHSSCPPGLSPAGGCCFLGSSPFLGEAKQQADGGAGCRGGTKWKPLSLGVRCSKVALSYLVQGETAASPRPGQGNLSCFYCLGSLPRAGRRYWAWRWGQGGAACTHNASSVPVPELAGAPCPAHCTTAFQPAATPLGFCRKGVTVTLPLGLAWAWGSWGRPVSHLLPIPFFPKPLLLAILAAGASLGGGGGGEGVLASF